MKCDNEQYNYFHTSTTSLSSYPVWSSINRPQIMSLSSPPGYSHKICRMERWRGQHSSSCSVSSLRYQLQSSITRVYVPAEDSTARRCCLECWRSVLKFSSSLLRWSPWPSFSRASFLCICVVGARSSRRAQFWSCSASRRAESSVYRHPCVAPVYPYCGNQSMCSASLEMLRSYWRTLPVVLQYTNFVVADCG